MSKSTHTHTKRSEEFQRKIEELIDWIRPLKGDDAVWTAAANDIIDILRNNTTDSGCIVKAKDDEPIFTLKASDITSWKMVRDWIEENAKHNPNFDSEAPKFKNASQCASEMLAYHTHKLAD